MAMISPILSSPPSFIAPRSTPSIVTITSTTMSTIASITSTATATFSTPSYTTLSPTTTTTTTSITPTSSPTCETESFFYDSCTTGHKIVYIAYYIIIAVGLFTCVFGVIFFIYDSYPHPRTSSDIDRDTDSETGIEIEMRSRHIEERVIEDAKADTARQLTRLQPVYSGV